MKEKHKGKQKLWGCNESWWINVKGNDSSGHILHQQTKHRSIVFIKYCEPQLDTRAANALWCFWTLQQSKTAQWPMNKMGVHPVWLSILIVTLWIYARDNSTGLTSPGNPKNKANPIQWDDAGLMWIQTIHNLYLSKPSTPDTRWEMRKVRNIEAALTPSD